MNPFTSGKILGSSIGNEEYQAFGRQVERGHPDYVMSRSDLMEFAHCPARWVRGYQRDDTSATDWGSLIDCLVLTPELQKDVIAVCPETYPGSKTGEPRPWNFNSTFCKEWKAEHEGKFIVKAPLMSEAITAAARLLEDPDIAAIVERSEKQVFVVANYRDRETGIEVKVKGLIDIVPPVNTPIIGGSLVDFKTARSADPAAWARVVFDRGYHVQGSLYLDAYNAATKEERNCFLHLIQENQPPYEPLTAQLSEEFLEIGRSYMDALKLYCRCVKNQEWPGYASRADLCVNNIAIVGPLPWMVDGFSKAAMYRLPDDKDTPAEPEGIKDDYA